MCPGSTHASMYHSNCACNSDRECMPWPACVVLFCLARAPTNDILAACVAVVGWVLPAPAALSGGIVRCARCLHLCMSVNCRLLSWLVALITPCCKLFWLQHAAQLGVLSTARLSQESVRCDQHHCSQLRQPSGHPLHQVDSTTSTRTHACTLWLNTKAPGTSHQGLKHPFITPSLRPQG